MEDHAETTISQDVEAIGLRRSMSVAKWQSTLQVFQLVRMKGKFWTKCGFSINGTNFLYPEEALWLLEINKLVISEGGAMEVGSMLTKERIFQLAIPIIGIPVYLTFLKLKSLEYIVQRHNRCARTFGDDAELYEYMHRHPSLSLLDLVVAYDLFVDSQNYSKSAVANKQIQPVAHVVICDGRYCFTPRIVLTLLAEAAGIPVIFASVSSTGFVMLEEISDALVSLDLMNEKKNRKKRQRTESPENSCYATDIV